MISRHPSPSRLVSHPDAGAAAVHPVGEPMPGGRPPEPRAAGAGPSPAEPAASPRGSGRGGTARVVANAVRHVLVAYAQVLFGSKPLMGAFALAATFVVPEHGLAGLLGLVLSNGWAHVLGRPREHIAEGYYGFNGLLVGLALGLFFRLNFALAVLLVVGTLLVTVVAAALRNLAERYVGVPVLSLPFVLVTWTVLLATRRFDAVEVTTAPLLAGLGWTHALDGPLADFVRSLAACYFQVNIPAGLLVLAGLLVGSRWAAILGALGFASGYALYVGLGGKAADVSAQLLGFNFLVTAVGVGGVFIVLSPASLALAAAAGALAALASAALLAWLAPLGLPVLSAPLIATTQLLLFAYAIRARTGRGRRGIQLVSGPLGTPEETVARAVYRAQRYPEPGTPLFFLPVMGEWVVTQGPGGEHTHKGLWHWGWDFEVLDHAGRRHRGSGASLADYGAFGAPVVAPADGRVVRVVEHLPDTAPGEFDAVNNWGNVVVVAHSGGLYSVLAHLAQGSVAVHEGQIVARGELLARVGASGRAPVPHLHFQVQRSPAIGAPSVEAHFLHYVVVDGHSWYVTHGVPGTDTRLRALEPDEVIRRALALPPGRTWRWRGEWWGRNDRLEEWRTDVDFAGRRYVRRADGRAAVEWYADTHYATALGYEGPGDDLLSLAALGLARVPFAADSSLRWRDAAPALALLPRVARVGHELLLPFRAVGTVPLVAHLEAAGLGIRVVAELDPRRVRGGSRLPTRIEVTCEPVVGPVRIVAWRGRQKLADAEVVDP